MYINSFYGGADISTYEKQLNNKASLTPQNSLLGNYYLRSYDKSQSFLEIKVTKGKYKNGKGKGSLTGLWSFSHYGTRGDKGFITFNEAKTSDTEKELVLTGGFYATAKNGSGQGIVSYSKEVVERDYKTLDKNNFDKYFPKPYWYTKKGGFDKYGYNNGGFIDGAADLDKICGADDSDCKVSESATSHTLKGEGYGDSGYRPFNCDNGPRNAWCDYIGNWSGDINSKSELQGYDHMYGKVGQLRLRDHLNPFNRGTWRQIPAKSNKK